MKAINTRLILMNFLEFAVWGAYLTSMGNFLASAGFAESIWLFYAMQGIVSIFMPALMGIVADRWIPAQRLLGLCHLFAGIFMVAAGLYGLQENPSFGLVFSMYALSVAFFMPTIALTNSVAFNALTQAGMDTVKAFPPIRVFGTVGFICTMWAVDLMGFQGNSNQFIVSGILSVVLAIYAQTLPACPVSKSEKGASLVKALGLDAFALFRQKRMAIFFIFSMLLGVSLQITNGYANPYIPAFKDIPEYASTFGVQHANILISLSQISETCCILLIPFCLKRFGIKNFRHNPVSINLLRSRSEIVRIRTAFGSYPESLLSSERVELGIDLSGLDELVVDPAIAGSAVTSRRGCHHPALPCRDHQNPGLSVRGRQLHRLHTLRLKERFVVTVCSHFKIIVLSATG